MEHRLIVVKRIIFLILLCGSLAHNEKKEQWNGFLMERDLEN
jgi:hypothetical protein